jgi:hypothetical protein
VFAENIQPQPATGAWRVTEAVLRNMAKRGQGVRSDEEINIRTLMTDESDERCGHPRTLSGFPAENDRNTELYETFPDCLELLDVFA